MPSTPNHTRTGSPGALHLARYLAIQSRDARFDGAFFTAVHTTGIYCRPVCPARTPKASHITFFETASAASAEGFRPCLRCHPGAAPGSPLWQGASGIVDAARRAIVAGFLVDRSVADLAATFEISPRHLGRLFVAELGTTPGSFGALQRLALAKQLLDESELSMTDVAMASGFQSLRRFNAAIKETWGSPPSLLRKMSRESSPTDAFTLLLQYRPPYAWDQVLSFLATRAVTGTEAVVDGRYTRVVRWGNDVGLVTVSHVPARNGVALRLSRALLPHCASIVSRIRGQFDLDARPDLIAATFGEALPLAAGLRAPGTFSAFEAALRAIVGQQVSVAAGVTFMGRLVERFGVPVEDAAPSANQWRSLPSPAALAEADLDGLGFTTRRRDTIRAVATAVESGQLQLDRATDLDAYLGALCALPGVGPWTANYVAMRGLHHPDAFPEGDLILRRQAAAAVGAPTFSSKDLKRWSQSYRPWRAYAAIQLWRNSTTAQLQPPLRESE